MRSHARSSFNPLPSPCLFSPPGRCTPSIRELRVSVGLRLLLPCVQLSPRPCSWEHPPHRHTRQHHSDLEVTVTEENLGKYVCTCQVHRRNTLKLMWEQIYATFSCYYKEILHGK